MSNFATGDRTYLMRQQRRNGNGLAVESYEFDFIAFTTFVDMYNSADIPRRQSLGR